MTAPDGLADRARGRTTGLERQLTPGTSGAGQDSDRLERRARERGDVGLAGPAGWAKHPSRGQGERHVAPGVDRRPTMGTLVKRRHEPEFAQASQLEPQDPPRPQFRVAQMPQGDPCRVEQPGVRIVIVRQIGQQFGDVVAGIQGRQIAAETCEALQRRGLGQEVQRLRRLGQQHDIGNAKQVKPTLEGRLQPPAPLGQPRHLPQLPGEERHNQAGLEHLDRPDHQRQRPIGRHRVSPPAISDRTTSPNTFHPRIDQAGFCQWSQPALPVGTVSPLGLPLLSLFLYTAR